MKWCVVGAGAIGGIVAGRLAAAGETVSVVARGPHLAAIRESGLTLVDHSRGGLAESYRLPASEDPLDLARAVGTQDVIVIGLKAPAIGPMLPRLSPLIGAQTVVVPAINGVPWWYFLGEGGPYDGRSLTSLDPSGDMIRALSARQLIGCVVHAAGEVRAPGVVHHTAGKRFILGEIDRSLADSHTSRLRRLTEALDAAGLEAVAARDIRHDVWAKLIGNLSFNPVAALTGSLINQICADEAVLSIVRPLLLEGMAVARAYGVVIAMTPDQRIDLARQLGSSKISMQQDFEAHRTPEIDAIVGAVIELAQWADVPVPTIRMMDALVRARARNLHLI